MKTPPHLGSCTECGSRLALLAEACPDCGYPHVGTSLRAGLPAGHDPAERARAFDRLLQTTGLIVLVTGILAAFAGARLAGGVVLATGLLIYLAGLLGAWWNRPA